MRSRFYRVLLITIDGRIVHRTCLVPKYFRWPFMPDGDLHVSPTWTHPEHQRRGLAEYALAHLAQCYGFQGRELWYITRPENAASVAVCRACCFEFVTHLHRTSRWGSLFLGSFIERDGWKVGHEYLAAHRRRTGTGS